MATDYEQFYREHKNGLGEPTQAFVAFFNTYDKAAAKVLDVGCGQGRDALPIARLGHSVTAIDLSDTGIQDLLADAKAEGLEIETDVVDIRFYRPRQLFDVIVIDRTLHMLTAGERRDVLRTLLSATQPGSHVLIADEPSNIPAFVTEFQTTGWAWKQR